MKHKSMGLALAAIAFLAAPSAGAETTLKFGTFVPPRAVVAMGAVHWMDAVEKDTAGRITFKRFFGGALSRSPRKQYELMKNGIQDATVILPSYTAKLFPDFALLELPYLFRSPEEASVAGWRFYKTGLMRGMDDIHVVSVFSNGNSAMHFSRVIASAKDIKGLKIRAPGPAEAAVIKLMGAVPVGMSITQVAESLNRGVIQGSLNGWSALRPFRITPLIKSHYNEPFGVRMFFTAIRKSVYNALSNKDRQVITKHGGEGYARFMTRRWQVDIEADMRKAKADPKRTVIGYSDAELEKRAAIFQPLHESWIKKAPGGAEKYNALMRILKQMRGSS